MITQNQPLMSIGLPVYNGEQLIKRALDTLLAQDYPKFELIICDNASTDETWNICKEYAARDARIRLDRNPTNIGANANFEKVLSFATGRYFMWAAHDDWWEPTFISRCIQRLEANPQAVLCHVRHVQIDEVRGQIDEIDYSADLENGSTWKRIHSLLGVWPWPMPNVYIYGVFRREMLVRIMPLANITGADMILLLRVAHLGVIVGVNEPLHKYSAGPRGRGLRIYIRQFAPTISRWRVLTWDWQLFFILLKLSQKEAPSLNARFRGAWAAGALVHRYTGWPLSPKMILNYLYILMPESLAVWLRQWLEKHHRVERLIMRLVNNRKALAD